MKIKGSVSLFMAMIFLLIISVIIATIMSATIHGAKAKISTAVSSSVDSVFAKYDKELFDEFGVLFFENKNTDYLCEEIRNGIQENLKVEDGVDLYNIKIKGVNISQIIHGTDARGLLWMDEVVDYEKYAKPIDMLADYLGIENCEEQLETMESIFEEVESITDTVVVINEKAQKLVELVCGITIEKNLIKEYNVGEYLTKMISPMNSVLVAKKSFLTNKTQGLDKIDNLKKEIKKILYTTEKVEVELGIIDFECNQIKIISNDIISKMDKQKSILGTEAVEGFCEEFESMGNYKEILAENIFDIIQLSYRLEKNKGILIEADKKMSTISSSEDFDEIIEILKDYSLDGYEMNYSYFVKERKKNNIISTIKKMFQSGILGLAIPDGDKVSTRKIEVKNLASDVINLNSENLISNCNVSTKSAKQIIYGEYVMDHFFSYTDKKSGAAINYEVEHIINGKKTDVEDLYLTVKKITLIRSVINMAYLMTDSEKKEQAQGLAELALGWTNIQPLINGAKYLILYTWAYGEGLTEVKALLSGWKIPLFKNKECWLLPYENFITINLNPDKDKCKKGLNYEMFLRALLMMNDLGKLSTNTMDLVELWKVKNKNADFRMCNQVYGIKGEVLYSIGKSEKQYTYTFAQTY